MYKLYRNFIKFVVVVLSFAILCGCTGVNFSQWHFPYMMEVEQGNYITRAEFDQLKIGQTKQQVSYSISYPLTQFMFDQNRWDFIYQDHKNDDLKKSYTVTLFFDANGKLAKIEKKGELFDK